ncbi:stonustoxin subunit alpha-like [Pholidichthys leucotaenia]
MNVLLYLPEPKTRSEFLKYLCAITLDLNTANTWLFLSDGTRRATYMSHPQFGFSHPDRFISHYHQVLSRDKLTGCCYWEVKWSGYKVGVAIAYKNISRRGYTDECFFGHSDKSWSLYCCKDNYSFWFNNVCTFLPDPGSSRIGVFLDHRAGILSFYSVSETMTLLHRVQTTFTQPLYAGLYLYGDGTTAELIKLK